MSDKEFSDPPEEAMGPEQEVELRAQPKRVLLVFQAADDGNLSELLEDVMEHGERSGLFGEHILVADIMLEDVAEGTPLHQVITGREPR